MLRRKKICVPRIASSSKLGLSMLSSTNSEFPPSLDTRAEPFSLLMINVSFTFHMVTKSKENANNLGLTYK